MTLALTRGAAFFVGFGIALLPAVGPFLAILYFITSRLHVRRSDLPWLAAIALYGLAPLATGRFDAFLSGSLQLLAGWLIFRAFAELRFSDDPDIPSGLIGLGLLTGLGLIVALNLLQVQAWNFGSAKTVAQAIVWQSSPALFGHTVLALGGLIAIVAPNRYVRLGALTLAALGILVSGSREAAIGWVLVALVLQFTDAHRSWRNRGAEILFLVLMVAVSTGLGPQLGWGRVGFLLQPSSPSQGANLLTGTELSSGDWWDTSWVSMSTRLVDLDGRELTAYRLQKNGDESWLRLQQAVELNPGDTYTVSTWIRADTAAVRPGIQGWGQFHAEEGLRSFVLLGHLEEGAFDTWVGGEGDLIEAGIAASEGDWKRVYATFRFLGSEPIVWFVGLAPNARTTTDGVAEFAGFQLEHDALGPYRPGSATRGLGLGVARIPYWQAALQGIEERPFAGWGASAFPDYFLQNWPGRSRLQDVPAHAHNFFLQSAFERGVLATVAVLLLVAALAGPALARGDMPLLAVIAAILFANVFDTTLMYGGVFYPLVAIAGWRAGAALKRQPERAAARQIAVRFSLALADAAAAALAFIAASRIGIWAFPILGIEVEQAVLPSLAVYGLLLWPALAWNAGLYPGYGLVPQQELKRHVLICGFAGLLLAAASLFFSNALPLSLPLLVLMVGFTMVTLPMGRAVAKRTLHAVGLWGRNIVILGAGGAGRRIVRSLLRTPLDGLHPVAFFDDATSLHGRSFHGVRVLGTLADADAYAARHDIQHAIVAIPTLETSTLRKILDTRGRHFRVIQYIPNLAGLPAEDVFASSLDGMLAIEVRNNLASSRNRAIKRAIDFVGGLVLLTLISPLFVMLAVWIRVDSRGPAVYRSRRLGQGGTTFECLKFRTMLADADARLHEMLSADARIREEYERFHKIENDPRITRAGRFLRTYSLDELPQLLNVIAGDMGLVGPRPYLTTELPLMEDHSEIILQAKPGMTGHWQVSGRNDVTFRDRLEMEAHYVRNWSIWWDIVILVKTLPAMLDKRGK